MDFLFNLSNVLNWIQEVIINGLLGTGFVFLREFFISYIQLKPLLDLLGLFVSFG